MLLYEGITVTSGCMFSGEAMLLLKTETLARIDGIHSQFVEVESHQEKKTAMNFETKLVEKYHETKIALSKVSPVIPVLLCKLRKKQAAKVTEKHKKQLDTQQDKRPRIDDIHSQHLKEFYYGRQEKENAIFKFLFDLMGKSETAPSFISLLETVPLLFLETAPSKEFFLALLSPFSVDTQVSPFELLEKQAANVTDMYLGYVEQLFTQRSKRARRAFMKLRDAVEEFKETFTSYLIDEVYQAIALRQMMQEVYKPSSDLREALSDLVSLQHQAEFDLKWACMKLSDVIDQIEESFTSYLKIDEVRQAIATRQTMQQVYESSSNLREFLYLRRTFMKLSDTIEELEESFTSYLKIDEVRQAIATRQTMQQVYKPSGNLREALLFRVPLSGLVSHKRQTELNLEWKEIRRACMKLRDAIEDIFKSDLMMDEVHIESTVATLYEPSSVLREVSSSSELRKYQAELDLKYLEEEDRELFWKLNQVHRPIFVWCYLWKRMRICNSTEDETSSVFVQTLPLCLTDVHDHFIALMKLADYKELNLIEVLLKFVSSDTLTKTLQSTPIIAEEGLLGLTADETKQNHIEITSASLIPKTTVFSQEIKVLSDHQMIILSDKYYSWLNSLHQSTVPYIPLYKKDWTSYIDYSILLYMTLYDEEKVTLAIQHTSGSKEEVYPGTAINCTAISDASSINCLQDAANSNSKEMTALWLKLINNQSNPSGTSGGPSYFHQDSSNSSIYYESALLDSDIDDSGMSVAIESDILSSVDRDVRVVRRKKMTDPSPAYRLQFYAQRYWRHEQIDSNETDFYVPTESSVIDADESESDYDIEHTNRTKQKSKINSLIQEYQNLTDYSSSEDSSHWSIFLRKDFK